MQQTLTPNRWPWIIGSAAAALLFLVGAGLIAILLALGGGTPLAIEPDTFLSPAVALGTPVDEQVATVAFSPNGKRLVTAGGRGLIPGQLKIWDVPTARELHDIRGIPSVRAAAFSPTAPVFATGDASGVLALRDAETGEEKTRTQAHAAGVLGVTFSRDGNLLATVGVYGVNLWTADRLVKQMEFIGHTDKVTAVAFFANGKALVTASHDGTAKIWDIATGTGDPHPQRP